jgi:hypothetical protein
VSGELWAIVGVVVGAIVGGAAQVVTQLVQSRTTRRESLREKRRDAYDAYLTAANRTVHLLRSYVNEAALGVVEGNHSFAPVLESRDEMLRTVARLHILAPADTWAAAETFDRAVRDYSGHIGELAGSPGGLAEAPPFPEVASARQSFVDLAKRDLGIDD